MGLLSGNVGVYWYKEQRQVKRHVLRSIFGFKKHLASTSHHKIELSGFTPDRISIFPSFPSPPRFSTRPN